MPGGPLTFAISAVADAGGNATLKVQFGSYAPPQAWAKVNIILDVGGSPSAQLIADTVVLDQAGGPQPQLGPAVFMANQNVTVVVTGAQPLSNVVAHVNGAWDQVLSNLDSITTLSGGTIGAQQIVGTPFLDNKAVQLAGSGVFTSAVFPMLGYSSVFIQFIVTVGSLNSMPTVQLQWLDNSVPPLALFQSNYQSQKEIDVVAAWGQQMQVIITNTDASHTLNMTVTLVPVAVPPARKADALTYKQTATNEIVGIHNTAVAHNSSTSATTAQGLGWSGPATIYLDTGWTSAGGFGHPPNFGLQVTYGPQGTGRTLFSMLQFCPNIVGVPIDLPNQPVTITFFNNDNAVSTTPNAGILAGYR